jgi:hypothetical protein
MLNVESSRSMDLVIWLLLCRTRYLTYTYAHMLGT